MSGQIQTVAERLAAILARPVGAADRARARLHVLDWAGCVSAGAFEPGAAEPRALAALEGAGPCRVVGGRRSGPQAAALANGPMGALLEMDDVDKRGLLHPGPVVMPATRLGTSASAIFRAVKVAIGELLKGKGTPEGAPFCWLRRRYAAAAV